MPRSSSGKMATLKSFLISLWILYHADLAISQSTEAFFRTVNGEYILCTGFTTEPTDCTPAAVPKEFLFPDISEDELNDARAHSCVDGFHSYHLFDTTPSQIYRVPLPVTEQDPPIETVLDTTASITGITSFEICCNRVFFSAGNEIYVQNMENVRDEEEVRITKRLLSLDVQIADMKLCCNVDNYFIYYSIDTVGLYRLPMDGEDSEAPEQMVNYETMAVQAFDVNCVNGHMALGVGDTVYVLDYTTFEGGAALGLTADLTSWVTRTGETVSDVSVATAMSGPNQPNLLTAWTGGSGSGFALTFSTDSATTNVISQPSLFTTAVDDVLLCLDPRDCSQGCPVGTLCPCMGISNYQSCCSGLCVPTNGPAAEDFTCFCSNEDTFDVEMCVASDALSSDSTDCPLDLIGAVKCQGGSRTSSSSIYAISANSLTSICAMDIRGKERPMPRGALPLMAHDMFSSAYLFKGPSNWNDFHGNRYGLYSVITTNPAQGESGENIYSIPVIVQERIDEIAGGNIVISANEGDEATIRFRILRYCNTGRIRWRKNGKFLKKYNGKVAIVFDSVTPSDEGIYEIYFQGRLKRSWRRIVRVIVRSDSCGTPCTERGSVCSYSGSYCICPPGRVGPLCASECPKGEFGLRGTCDFNCGEVFGEECSDCQNVLFCSEDPLGCQCYPGYKLPYCTPCPTNFFGLNCEQECDCNGEECDPYDGTCPTSNADE